jgi:uncharacterized spore protein YtfJ
MRNMRRFVVWLTEVLGWVTCSYWYVICPAFILFIHLGSIQLLNVSTDQLFSKILFLVTQMTGAILVLNSINSNLKSFNSSLLDLIRRPLEKFPRFRRQLSTRTLRPNTGTAKAIGLPPKLSIVEQPETLEEKIQYLTRRIEKIEGRVDQEMKDTGKYILNKEKDRQRRFKESEGKIAGIEAKMKDIYTNPAGLGQQVFGVLLALHQPVVEIMSILF